MTVRLPGALAEATGGATKVEAQGGSLRELVADLERRYPALEGRILDRGGAMPAHVNVFIGDDDARDVGGAAAPIPDGTLVMVIPAMAGGADRA
ncbi:MAG TPA: MoaD/ThiS family protein [Candidatus Limnocylindrales bacterium]|nr:MoaD/ThiS family protein [Candidatus Limnocylindrales bacterium]